MAQKMFGVGQLIIVPPGANPTPLQLGTLQEVQEDIKFTTKKLVGQYQFPVAIARAQGDYTLKAKFAEINGQLYNDFLTGSTKTGGLTNGAINEPWTIPTTPFEVTVTNSATWVGDGGVLDLTTGLPMTRVASGPTTGQYSVAAGVYTFAAADAGNSVWISYQYTISASGFTTKYTNQLMGSQTTFSIFLYNTFNGNIDGQVYYAGILSSLSLPRKNEDFLIADLEIDILADSSGRIVDKYTTL